MDPRADRQTPRRGAFPGSFNPLTVAHLEVASRARDEHDLDIVDLVVSEVALDKPAPPGPPFDERIRLLEADAAEFDWLEVSVTNRKLIADIAQGYDIVIMGADKWEQLHDVRYYNDSEAERDAALARLPQVIVAQRSGHEAPLELRLETPAHFHSMSSTDARAGNRRLMAPEASKSWRHRA